MQYVCDAGESTWFRIETQGEATLESRVMNHTLENNFREAYETAASLHSPAKSVRFVEQNIGLKAHIQRTMPMFLTLRAKDGTPVVTAILPPSGRDERSFRPIVIGPANTNPYPKYGAAIRTLGERFGLALDPSRSYRYNGR